MVSAYFEAVALAGFGEEEAKAIFGRPPRGVKLQLEALPAAEAEAKFIERFERLSKATDRAAAKAAAR